jgi:hypothetical protein
MSSKRTTKQKPSKAPSAKLGVAPNIEAAAARMNLSKEFLQDLKNAGCDAFAIRGSVDCDKAAAYLAEHPEFVARWNGEGGVPPRAVSIAVRAHFDAMEAKRKHEEKIRKVIARARFAEIAQRVGERQRAILKQHVTPEVLAKLCAEMQPLFDECLEGAK